MSILTMKYIENEYIDNTYPKKCLYYPIKINI